MLVFSNRKNACCAIGAAGDHHRHFAGQIDQSFEHTSFGAKPGKSTARFVDIRDPCLTLAVIAKSRSLENAREQLCVDLCQISR